VNLIKRVLSLYSPKYPASLVYIAQSSEYRILPYLSWYWELPDFNRVQERGRLDKTKVGKLLLMFLMAGIFIQYILSLALIVVGLNEASDAILTRGILGVISAPIIWAYLLCLPLWLGRVFVITPQEMREFKGAQEIFKNHKGVKIAVLGSYGKTTMKELLITVLGDDLKVAATPANLNVVRSISKFAKNLDGDEDVLIVEFGEEKPGDITTFAKLVGPDYGFITGLAPAHLSHYKNMKAISDDLLSIADFVDPDKLYYNAESSMLSSHIGDKFIAYRSVGVRGWKASSLKLSHKKTSFVLKKGKHTVKVESGLLGQHQVGPLSAAVAVASELGIEPNQIQASVKQTKPFEHRMESRELNGAWIIDDTYNGNLEGVKAGLELLKSIDAKRKIYVTPGLVEQGDENETVHHQIGVLIASAKPNLVVLMQNSVTDYIVGGLNEMGFDGELRIEDQPLQFYMNIEHLLAKGDLVLMQNDWPDYYR